MIMKTFRFWCNKVLPLVYDDSLSYYEVLCKVVDYINKLIEQDKIFGDELARLSKELQNVQKWIDDFDISFIKEYVDEYIATMIFIEISEEGYIIYYIPEKWNDVRFETTGLDVTIQGIEYGRLVLNY